MFHGGGLNIGRMGEPGTINDIPLIGRPHPNFNPNLSRERRSFRLRNNGGRKATVNGSSHHAKDNKERKSHSRPSSLSSSPSSETNVSMSAQGIPTSNSMIVNVTSSNSIVGVGVVGSVGVVAEYGYSSNTSNASPPSTTAAATGSSSGSSGSSGSGISSGHPSNDWSDLSRPFGGQENSTGVLTTSSSASSSTSASTLYGITPAAGATPGTTTASGTATGSTTSGGSVTGSTTTGNSATSGGSATTALFPVSPGASLALPRPPPLPWTGDIILCPLTVPSQHNTPHHTTPSSQINTRFC